MAITPGEARMLSQEEQAWVERQETSIDAILKTQYSPGRKVVVSRPKPPSQKAFNELIARYTKAGWNVTTHSDQRDGDWLEFGTGDIFSQFFNYPPGVR